MHHRTLECCLFKKVVDNLKFRLVSEYKPTGDQPLELKTVKNLKAGVKEQTLLERRNERHTATLLRRWKTYLSSAHNKTLADSYIVN